MIKRGTFKRKKSKGKGDRSKEKKKDEVKSTEAPTVNESQALNNLSRSVSPEIGEALCIQEITGAGTGGGGGGESSELAHRRHFEAP